MAGAAAAWFDNAYTWILAGRVMQGIGAAGTTPMAMALNGDLFKGGEQSKVLGLVEASNGFWQISQSNNWLITGATCLVRRFLCFSHFLPSSSILLTIFFIKEKKPRKNPRRSESM